MKMQQARQEADRLAATEAAGKLEGIAEQIRIELADGESQRLPASPDLKSTLSRGSSTETKFLPLTDRTESSELAQTELQIWLAQNGYRLAKSSSEAPDFTREFIEWKRSHHLGR